MRNAGVEAFYLSAVSAGCAGGYVYLDDVTLKSLLFGTFVFFALFALIDGMRWAVRG